MDREKFVQINISKNKSNIIRVNLQIISMMARVYYQLPLLIVKYKI